MFAQIPNVTGAQLMVWLGCLAFVIALVNQAMKLDDRMRGTKNEITPQPLEVKAAIEWVRQDECKSRHAQVATRTDGLEKQVQDLRRERLDDVRAAALSRKGIYDAINKTKTEMSEQIDGVRKELAGHTENV